mmetsp:Transcript_122602/g.358045  ORF Transcript_122602/g.358045 Transcript_122602/m.358045 type:complete len:319 (+) Transcript_122602:685-1641(+)
MLASCSPDDPILAVAIAVRTSHRDVRLHRPSCCRMENLSLVLVADYVKPLVASDTNADPRAVKAAVTRAGFHWSALQASPRASHIILVVVCPTVQLRHLRLGVVHDLLPRYMLVLSEIPREAPLKLDAIESTCFGIITAAIKQPTPIFGVPIGPTYIPKLSRKINGRVYGLPLIPVEHDTELFAACLTKGHCHDVLALGQRLHFRRLGPGIPGANDEYVITRLRPRHTLLLYPGILRALQPQRMQCTHLRRGAVAGDASGPKIGPGIGAPDSEGGDSRDAHGDTTVRHFRGKERRVAHELYVRVDTLEVQVWCPAAAS